MPFKCHNQHDPEKPFQHVLQACLPRFQYIKHFIAPKQGLGLSKNNPLSLWKWYMVNSINYLVHHRSKTIPCLNLPAYVNSERYSVLCEEKRNKSNHTIENCTLDSVFHGTTVPWDMNRCSEWEKWICGPVGNAGLINLNKCLYYRLLYIFNMMLICILNLQCNLKYAFDCFLNVFNHRTLFLRNVLRQVFWESILKERKT